LKDEAGRHDQRNRMIELPLKRMMLLARGWNERPQARS
jgi:hypothetical protein